MIGGIAELTRTTVGATTDVSIAPRCNGVSNQGLGVWFWIDGDGTQFLAETCSSTTKFDTVLSVFQGNCTKLVCVAANDDGGAACSDGRHSAVSWNTVAGRRYYIHVRGYTGSRGVFNLQVYRSPNPPRPVTPVVTPPALQPVALPPVPRPSPLASLPQPVAPVVTPPAPQPVALPPVPRPLPVANTPRPVAPVVPPPVPRPLPVAIPSGPCDISVKLVCYLPDSKKLCPPITDPCIQNVNLLWKYTNHGSRTARITQTWLTAITTELGATEPGIQTLTKFEPNVDIAPGATSEVVYFSFEMNWCVRAVDLFAQITGNNGQCKTDDVYKYRLEGTGSVPAPVVAPSRCSYLCIYCAGIYPCQAQCPCGCSHTILNCQYGF
jgi:hypothetical protein